VSRTANDEQSATDQGWFEARNELFRMIMEGRSFSGRERNCFFLNLGRDRFATASALSGIDFPDDGRAIALCDWDGDGAQDLWISNRNAPRLRFLRNGTPSEHHFLSIGLVGNGTTTNRDGIGARIEVIIEPAAAAISTPEPSARPGTAIVETLRAGEGFLSQSSKWVHFGLGAQDRIRQVIVHWPGGGAQTFSGVKVDQRYRLIQDQIERETVERRPVVNLAEREQAVPSPTRRARVALSTRVPMPPVTFENSTGQTVAESFSGGAPTLVNLWASWCLPCMEELADITAARESLQASGLRVISLSVDRLAAASGADEAAGDARAPDDAVRHTLRRLGYPFRWGHADAVPMNLLQQLHDQFFFQKRPLPLPSSFLIDAEGRLAVIYKGPVTAEQLLADAELVRAGRSAGPRDAACFEGSVIEHPRFEAVARRADLQTRYRIAAWLEETQRFAAAERNFTELAARDPDWALPQWHLAKLHLNQRRLDEARRFADRAISLDPSSARAQNTLGLIHSEQHDPVRAAIHLRKAIDLSPDFPEAQNNLGTVLASQGKLSEARKCFERAVELDEEFAEAYTNLGSVHAALNNVKTAIEHYERAVRIDPRYVDAHNNLGTMYARQGNVQRAVDQYRHVLSIDPAHRDARRNLERLQMLLRNPRGAGQSN
jgi:tetratricopeptide (TPR) repeat protein/thiol-disulfide isomerase/thioredoxin